MPKNDTAQLLGQADAALTRADASELHKLFGIVSKECDELMTAFETIVEHYSGSAKVPRVESHTPDAIDAMRQVSLAAIDLARTCFASQPPPVNADEAKP